MPPTSTPDFPDSVIPRALHVGHLEEVDTWFQSVQDDLGVPDVLVNNAGTNPYFGPMLGTEWAAWDKTFEVNLKGPFAMTQAFVKRLFTVPKGGSIINTSSVLGTTASRMQGVYGMTKAAMISMTKTLALELGGTRVRVNAVAPGVIETRLASALTGNDAIVKMITERTALGRVGQPAELAGVMVFLASDESTYVTGQTLFVDGGYTIY